MMDTVDRYLILTRDKNNQIISSNEIYCGVESAKILMGMLIYQTGVRTGQLFKREKDRNGNTIGFITLVDEAEIYHYGE